MTNNRNDYTVIPNSDDYWVIHRDPDDGTLFRGAQIIAWGIETRWYNDQPAINCIPIIPFDGEATLSGSFFGIQKPEGDTGMKEVDTGDRFFPSLHAAEVWSKKEIEKGDNE